jgi:branched-chain amino acid transport system substrate-binding protein
LLNGFINDEFWMPVPKVQFRGVANLISRYQARAAAERVDPPGYSLARWGYAQLQVLQQAVEAIKTLDDAKLADYLREQVFTAVVGDVRFGAKGEWAQTRVLQVQYQNIRGSDITQFKDMSTQVVVAPAEYASGEII